LERRLARGAQPGRAVAPVPREPAESEPDSVTAEAAGGAAESAPAPVLAASGEESSWPDAAAESAYLAEARSRGEGPAPSPKAEAAEESDATPLPPLEQLVGRVPAEVRELLDDLFRARFVRTTRIPRRALKD
jgi:hypothetical protein